MADYTLYATYLLDTFPRISVSLFASIYIGLLGGKVLFFFQTHLPSYVGTWNIFFVLVTSKIRLLICFAQSEASLQWSHSLLSGQ